jgi:hypothetical protein
MRLRYAATLEFLTLPPETVRGEFDQPNARLGARRAAEALFRAYPGRTWSSFVVVIERLDATDEADAGEQTDELSAVP